MRLPGSVLQGILARAALVFLRIYLGVVFLLWARSMIQTPAGGWLAPSGWENAPQFYQQFLGRVVIPNADFFAAAEMAGSLLLGVTLVLGLLTRLSATVALIATVNYILATGSWSHAAMGAISIALLIGAAGRTFGLDSMLARRWPRSPLW